MFVTPAISLFRASIRALVGVTGLGLVFIPSICQAQQLEPRAFAPNPAGVSFISVSSGHTDGDVLLDAESPVQDFHVTFYDLTAGYAKTFALHGRVASFGVGIPYVSADASGVVNGDPQSVSRSGFGDTRLRLTVSLLSGSALKPAEFARAAPNRTLGLSLAITAPTGQYYADKLVNIGTNRWAFKPELGGALRFGSWDFDGSLGVWLFTDNNNYLSGSRRSQKPVGALQLHTSYSFAPRLWLGVSITGYAGGVTTVDGQSSHNSQNNSRAGITLALPVSRKQSLKFVWNTGTTTRTGGDFTTFTLAWQFLWFD